MVYQLLYVTLSIGIFTIVIAIATTVGYSYLQNQFNKWEELRINAENESSILKKYIKEAETKPVEFRNKDGTIPIAKKIIF